MTPGDLGELSPSSVSDHRIVSNTALPFFYVTLRACVVYSPTDQTRSPLHFK
ncbi:hypothetical protein J6590_064341, partial [Homalodisca vitripennis]